MELQGGEGGRERFAGAVLTRLCSGGGAQSRRSALGRGYCRARSDLAGRAQNFAGGKSDGFLHNFFTHKSAEIASLRPLVSFSKEGLA